MAIKATRREKNMINLMKRVYKQLVKRMFFSDNKLLNLRLFPCLYLNL